MRSPLARSISLAVLERAAERRRLATGPRELREAGDRQLHGRRELLGPERLHEVGHGAGLPRALEDSAVGVARQDHHGAGAAALDLGRGVDPVASGQADGDHGRVRPLPRDQVDSRAGGVRLRHHRAAGVRRRRPAPAPATGRGRR